MYISLGSDCCMRKRIDEFLNPNQASNCFDWVITDLDSITTIIESTINDCNIFNLSNWQIKCETNENKYCIEHKFCNFVSLHDVNSNVNEAEAYLHVQDKYTRRLNRLIETIRNEKITFIGMYDKENELQTGNMMINKAQVVRFWRVINEINPLNDHNLIIIHDNNEFEMNTGRVKTLYSKKYKTEFTCNKDWYRYYYDWAEIFKSLKLIEG